MQVEQSHQFVTPHGVVFDINTFTIPPQACCHLRALSLPFVHKHHYRVVEAVAQLYDRMLPGNLPCHMQVGVSRPLTRQQGDQLNEQRHVVSSMLGSWAGKAVAMTVSGPAGLAAGAISGGLTIYATTHLAKEKIPTFHVGDVLVLLLAQVKGGIGPQSSSALLII